MATCGDDGGKNKDGTDCGNPVKPPATRCWRHPRTTPTTETPVPTTPIVIPASEPDRIAEAERLLLQDVFNPAPAYALVRLEYLKLLHPKYAVTVGVNDLPDLPR